MHDTDKTQLKVYCRGGRGKEVAGVNWLKKKAVKTVWITGA